ncbi:MAG: NTP transferase domain-containing protein [Lentisphaerae bacterium]|nr:NTP transferase domain-containing protein [Lentisphaerota bacterium]
MSKDIGVQLGEVLTLDSSAVLNPGASECYGGVSAAPWVLVLLAAGRGSRFGTAPKCVQQVRGRPLARHTIDAFRDIAPAPCIVLVGYARDEVMAELGEDNIYVESANSVGGTAWAAYEALSVPGVLEADPLLLISMGDRVIPEVILRRLHEVHTAGSEAALSLLTASHTAPAQHGKGRILRGADGGIVGIIEQRDIDAVVDPPERQRLDSINEANCPLYLARASTLHRLLGALTNNNAQNQYYFTDIVAALVAEKGEIRALTVTPDDLDYPVLCADVTRPPDLARLESLLAIAGSSVGNGAASVAAAAGVIAADRSPGQTASIAAQLRELLAAGDVKVLDPARPVAIGISGGRFRIAFMHPDMGRFYGPAWQMPTGAADAEGRGQLALLAQQSDDGRIHHLPVQESFREKVTSVAADEPAMFPSAEVDCLTKYESFGTHLAEHLLLSLGYFSDGEIRARREAGLPLPPNALWVGNSMRRPFALICNAIASLRTLREGPIGNRVQECLCRDRFRGLRIISTGEIPQGGFSSSSALTVAVKNALNVLYGFGLPEDTLIHLACQAEYGTGVRAGSLDQATEQKGKYGQGALISSNPRDNYRVLGVFPVPTERVAFVFPYSVDRDREAWRWSAGVYADAPTAGELTTAEMRKLTGKATELAALLAGLPADRDLFTLIEEDMLDGGVVKPATQTTVYAFLRSLPLLISREVLHQRLVASGATYATLEPLFSGWRDPLLRRTAGNGEVVTERGIPLRAIVGYLFVEMARCFRLLNDHDRWIDHVTSSQRGDCSFEIDPANLPEPADLLTEMAWERGINGPERLTEWLRQCRATPFDYNRDLDNETLAGGSRALHELRGGAFFRGLALLDLAEAMLKRYFGAENVALRVNAAGQGDYFQVHIDTGKVSTEAVKEFLDRAFYARFGLRPVSRYVEPHPGGGAVGVRLDRAELLPQLISELETCAGLTSCG